MPASINLKFSQQILTSFPNQNHYHIDYVICYERLDEKNLSSKNQEKNLVQKIFFEKLKEEKFNIYEIKSKSDSKTLIYCLLNCSKERLLKEAELTRLEMTLKNVV